MLFDEKELNIFDNNESKNYFKEILQCYYSQNYRATIVMLYSFVIYDLFAKLQTMANEGNKKAESKLKEINFMIADDQKYSSVENVIIDFYKENCPLYFKRFVEDIEYLKNCRNKCAHLIVDDSSLYAPSDYHARMLICSMYDNILSVKAPFITDLFSFVENDIEKYTSQLFNVPNNGLAQSIINDLTVKYFKRLTYDSLKKSYKTFMRLLLVSDDSNAEKNILGLYAFSYSLTDYIIKNGYVRLFSEADVQEVFEKINIDSIKLNPSRINALVSLMINFSIVLESVSTNAKQVFDYISELTLSNPLHFHLYRTFFPRSGEDALAYFNKTDKLKQARYANIIYDVIKGCDGFDINKYMIEMVKRIPNYMGYDDADLFMNFFITNLSKLDLDTIKEVMKIYGGNSQCTNRGRHSEDINTIKKYLEIRDKT